jgi:PAS domain S-box-containing protein
VQVNRRLRELVGYDEADLIGAPAAALSASDDADRDLVRDELLADGVSRRRVTQLRRKDGSVFSAITSAVVSPDDGRQPRYVIARADPLEPGSLPTY